MMSALGNEIAHRQVGDGQAQQRPSRSRKPSVVGYHWFEHADQPAEGRFDGENSNYGTVTIEDNPYLELTETMTMINAAAEQLQAKAAQPRERRRRDRAES